MNELLMIMGGLAVGLPVIGIVVDHARTRTTVRRRLERVCGGAR